MPLGSTKSNGVVVIVVCLLNKAISAVAGQGRGSVFSLPPALTPGPATRRKGHPLEKVPQCPPEMTRGKASHASADICHADTGEDHSTISEKRIVVPKDTYLSMDFSPTDAGHGPAFSSSLWLRLWLTISVST